MRASAKRPRVNSLCAASNALNAAASSCVGFGGGEGGTGFLKMSCFLSIGFVFKTRPLGFLAVVAAAGRLTLVGFRGLAIVFGTRFLATAPRAFGFCLVAPTFAALCARAFPAGERLVAGFRRVDLPAKTRLRLDVVADE